jgi:hypothetical protein
MAGIANLRTYCGTVADSTSLITLVDTNFVASTYDTLDLVYGQGQIVLTFNKFGTGWTRKYLMIPSMVTGNLLSESRQFFKTYYMKDTNLWYLIQDTTINSGQLMYNFGSDLTTLTTTPYVLISNPTSGIFAN